MTTKEKAPKGKTTRERLEQIRKAEKANDERIRKWKEGKRNDAR